MPLTEITYFCKIDNSRQPAMFRRSASKEMRPLVVALHTWSYDHSGYHDAYCAAADAWDWHLIFPKFRGPNDDPAGCGSDLVVSDLEDAVAFMKEECHVDPNRIYLVGGSGGGHCSLLMAGRRPDLWSAVSSWCPISDIRAWHAQCLGTPHEGYSKHIESACGGNPHASEAAAMECRLRSPMTWLVNARRAGVTVDINTGIHDGHTGSVPVSQALNAFNILADENERFSADEIDFMVREEKIPAGLEYKERDEAFGEHTLLLRRQSAAARMNVFEGSHNIFPAIAFEWLSRQVRGKAPDWSKGSPIDSGSGELSR